MRRYFVIASSIFSSFHYKNCTGCITLQLDLFLAYKTLVQAKPEPKDHAVSELLRFEPHYESEVKCKLFR